MSSSSRLKLYVKVLKGLLHASITNKQSMYLNAMNIIAGNFNHADLNAALPKFHQHVKCAIRGDNTLDKVYSNITLGYRARPLPHLGQSDHLFLTSAYAPLRKTAPAITKTVVTWPDRASQQLQDCFERTNWTPGPGGSQTVFCATLITA